MTVNYTSDNEHLINEHKDTKLKTSSGGYTYNFKELIDTIVGNQLHAEKQKGNKWNMPIALVVCVCVCIYQYISYSNTLYSKNYNQLSQRSAYQDDDMPSQNFITFDPQMLYDDPQINYEYDFSNATSEQVAIYELQKNSDIILEVAKSDLADEKRNHKDTFTSLVETQRELGSVTAL